MPVDAPHHHVVNSQSLSFFDHVRTVCALFNQFCLMPAQYDNCVNDAPPPLQLNIACSGAGFSEWMHDTGANGCAQNAYGGAAWRCIEGYCLCQHELNPDTVTSVSACARPSS